MDQRQRDKVAGVVNVVCAVALIVFALVLMAGWFDYADAAHKRPSNTCRNAHHCKPPKAGIPTVTALPTQVPCPNLCTPTDLTTAWPTDYPTTTVTQTFPSPLYP